MNLVMTATSVCEKMKTKGIDLGQRMSYLPLSFSVGENQWIVIFRFGVVVTVGLHEKELQDIFAELEKYMETPLPTYTTETLNIELGSDKDALDDECLYLKELRREHVLVLADILAKSVMLDRYEALMSEEFTEIEPVAKRLIKGRGVKINSKALTQRIGASLLIQQVMVGRVEVHEKPEILWETPELSKLYTKLEDEYEIEERNSALQKKLQLITNTAETQLELINKSHSLRVEWYIVILIVVEIFLTLYEMFIKQH